MSVTKVIRIVHSRRRTHERWGSGRRASPRVARRRCQIRDVNLTTRSTMSSAGPARRRNSASYGRPASPTSTSAPPPAAGRAPVPRSAVRRALGGDRQVKGPFQWLPPIMYLRDEHKAVSRGVPLQELDRLFGPVDRRHLCSACGGDERGQPEPAAELDHAHPVEPFRQRGDERRRRRPQLRPVRQELVVSERVLVEELLGCLRAKERERQRSDANRVLDEAAQSSASRPTVTPAGSVPSRSSASRTPGTYASRDIASCRIVNSSPGPPSRTSWWATRPGSRTE